MKELLLRESGGAQQKSDGLPLVLLWFDSESYNFEKDKKKTIEHFVRRGGIWRVVDYLEKHKALDLDRLDLDHLANLAEKGDFYRIVINTVSNRGKQRRLAGFFFEGIAVATLDLRLLRDQFVLNPEETATLIKIIAVNQRFRTIPDGFVFAKRHNLGQMVGVAEYKLRPNFKRFDEQWAQYRNLQEMVNSLSAQPPRGEAKGQIKGMLKARDQTVKKISSEVGSLTIYYVVPNGLANEFGFPQDDGRLKIIESPFTRDEILQMLGTLYFDYLQFRVKNGAFRI